MILVVLRSRVRPEAADAYSRLANEMREIARTMPGFISVKSYFAEDGEKVTVHEWESAEHLQAWSEHPEHLKTKQRGREEFFEDYTVFTCDDPKISPFSR